MSILLGRPIALRDEDCTVHFPRELDDEWYGPLFQPISIVFASDVVLAGSPMFSITKTEYLSQPHGKTALISGLNYISRIFALLGEILIRIRVDKRSPPTGPFATARLEEVQSLHARIMAALIHAPELLRLKEKRTQSNIPHKDGGEEFRHATFAEVKDMFDNPHASRENALNPYLVMQANIYVTQVSI